MERIDRLTQPILAVFFLLTFFSAGGAAVEGFVNYPTWLLIDKSDFKAYHNALGPRIVVTMVIPFALSTVFNVLLFWFRPPSVPRWSVWATVVLALIGWVATATVQIPIQIQLGETGYSKEAIEQLIRTDLLMRSVPGYSRLSIAFWMLLRILSIRSFSQVNRLQP
ncbi:hypothetical protein [Spirosoma montaniterrae]|uniref:DUF1772 domain-containing protein n=1 Tax=Spirosoma montaniterrae TaxID=1178516 RepID=A0A1P9WYN7_9BACT|nr:hypothetical protein [Spirosoma montaniterrae]AQG80479.1 hypothetical protein AWR27_14800 [Spirosoma montaniterrae]